MPRPIGYFFICLCFSLCLQAQDAASPDYFEAKVRPILANNCYGCHTDSKMGGLRLDSREDLLKGGSRGPAIVPGDPEKSLMITAVRQTDPKLKMPAGGKLKSEEVDILVAWVKAGAKWPAATATGGAAAPSAAVTYVISPERRKFWSFLPLQNPKPPAVKDPHWSSDIDRFILANLEKQGLKPAHMASRRDLVRRATLDLTGLPPTPEEIDAFERDKSPDAFAKVVDRLLASPRYGERWGRYWLDVARYGEDDYRSLNPNPRGYFPYANAYLYRDWVIQAVNDDLPYDQFIKAQIAGDLLEEKDRAKMLPATGFLGLGPWYFDNGAVEVTRADERHDRVDVITRGFLGLTVACARCHDHKYDPIPQTDYYSLAGVFASTEYHEYPQVPKSVLDTYSHLQDEVEKQQKVLQEMQANFATQLAESLALETSNYLQGVWEVTGPEKKEKATVVEQRKLDYELLDRWITYMAKTTDKYHNKEPWQAMMKKGGTSEEAKKLADDFQEQVVKVMLARRDLNEENEIIADQALPGTKKKKRANKPNEFITNDDFCPGCGLRLKNMPEDQTSFWTEIFQRELKDSEDIAAMMAMGPRMGTPGVLLFRGWGLERRVGASAREQMTSVKADIEQLQKKLQPAYPFVHGVEEAAKPVDLPVSLRGNPYNLGPIVPRHFLSVLSDGPPKPFEHGSGRLELADDIVKQPIAMRVFVNRIWRGHFGTGIVDTPSNFGMTGERPTNPELLEYLASYFVKNGMSAKKLHRAIMLTTVYQLSTEEDKEDAAKDSGNRYYWRANRKRLDAEQLRDSVLMVSGNLDPAMGGPSEDLTPAFTRRTVYGRVSRYKLDQYLQLFDFPTPNISAEKRFTTTVPLQRLFLMNSDFMQVESEQLVKRIAAEPDNRSRIRKAYLLIYGRAPTEEEIKLGLDYLHSEPMREYTENKDKPKQDDGSPRHRRGEGAPVVTTAAAKPAPEAIDAAADGAGGGGGANAGIGMGMGMMGGMGFGGRRGQGPAPAPETQYEPTVWGRYIKVLFSSTEFLFVN